MTVSSVAGKLKLRVMLFTFGGRHAEQVKFVAERCCVISRGFQGER